MRTDIGALYQGEGICRFVVWAPEANTLHIRFTSDDQRSVSFVHEAYGYWFAEIDGVYPGDRYYYCINSGPALPDPASGSQPQGIYGPSEVVDHKYFSWTDQSWKNIPLKEMILYELHTGTFTEPGTFDGIISKLPYLKELGINAIEIMPLTEFPGYRNWGYDGVFPFAPHHMYGGPEKLKMLVNKCHEEGIAVILDVVYNHFGPEGNFFTEYGPYYTEDYKTPWGPAINFDGPHSDEVRNYFIQNALMWLRDYHIDGLRLDAVHAYKDYSAHHFLRELTECVRKLSHKTGKEYLLIGECDLNDPAYIQPLGTGHGLDGQWCDEFHHALHALCTGERDGYYEDFGDLEHLYRAFKNSYVYTGQYSQRRKKTFGRLPENQSYSQFIVFAQNHDQIGNRLSGERLSTLVSFETLKLIAGTLLTFPSVPLLFMGEEYGEENPFLYFTSHTRPALINAVAEGRKTEFSYSREKEPADPQSKETFRRSKLSWEFADEKRSTLAKWYKELISLRKNHPVFAYDQRMFFQVEMQETSGVLEISRSSDTGVLLFIVLNFSKHGTHFSLPEGNWNLVQDSASIQWKGPGNNLPQQVSDPALKLSIRSQSIVIYTQTHH